MRYDREKDENGGIDAEMKKWQNRIRQMKIRSKLSMAFIPVVVVIIALTLVFINKIMYTSSLEKAEEMILDECKIIQVRLDSMRDNVTTCANMITADINRIYEESADSGVDTLSFLSLQKSIFAALDYDRRCFADVDAILFLDCNGNMSHSGLDTEPDQARVWEELVDVLPKKGLAVCIQFPLRLRSYLEPDEPVLVFGKRILDMNTGKILGYLFLNVKESTISRIFPAEGSEALQRSFFLLDEEGVIVSSTQKETLGTEPAEENLLEKLESSGETNYKFTDAGGTELYVGKQISKLSMTLVSQISIEDLTKDIRATSTVILLIGALGILIATAFLIVLGRRITEPIKALQEAAEHMQDGDFTTRCEVRSGDEIGMLSETFNVMASKIQGLIVQVKEEQKKKRRYELALLQTQIKPHFLYNTLDLIYVFCLSGKAEQGAKLTKSLADFYRTSLSSGREIISLREELKNVRNYLYIQRERYYDIMDFSIDYEPEIEEASIVKLTLQPLVENALYHGLKGQKGKGMIRITGKRTEFGIELTVEDDGVGMSVEKLREIRESAERKEHFGLKSVDARLKLYFGEAYGIEIESKPQKGTRIWVRIPERGKMQDDDSDYRG